MAILKDNSEVRGPTGSSEIACYINANFNNSTTEVPVDLPSGTYVAVLTNKASFNPSKVHIITDSVIHVSLDINSEATVEKMFYTDSPITSVAFHQNIAPGKLNFALYRVREII